MIRRIAAFFCLYAGTAVATEEIPQIIISEILPPSIAQSVSYRVEEGTLEGDHILFRIESDFGDFTIDSIPLLISRVREISILNRAVNQVGQQNQGSSEYSRGKYHVSADSALDILTQPLSTASNVAGQVRSNFENNSTAESPEIYMEYSAGRTESDDPVIAMHKRNVASQWGLDVYSSNPLVQKFLNEAASERSAGKISAGAPVMERVDLAPFKIENRNIELEIRRLVKINTISELEDLNNQILSGINLSDEVRLRFLHHRMYSPRYQTAIIHYLDLLRGVVNRSAFIQQAVEADSESSALGYEIAAMMLAHYHQNIAPLLKLYTGNKVLQAVSGDNRILYFSTSDMIYWSEENDVFFNTLNKHAKQAGFSGKEIVTSGDITDEASAQLQNMGFLIRKRIIF